MAGFFGDCAYAVRLFRRRPLFSIGLALVLGVGIGLVTAICSLVNAQLYRPWQVDHAERMGVVRSRPAKEEAFGAMSIAEYRYLRDRSHTVEQMAAWIREGRRLDGNGPYLKTTFVNADYFSTLRVGMMAGRGFSREDENYNDPPAVAILSEPVWRTRFNSDPAVIGRSILLENTSFVVIGVAERGFAGVENQEFRTDLWLPLSALAIQRRRGLPDVLDPNGTTLDVLSGRMRSSVTRSAAAAELTLLSRQFRAEAGLPFNGIDVLETRPTSMWSGQIPHEWPRTYGLIFIAALLVLILTSANAGNLLLAHGLSRRREIMTKMSLGASRARVVRQLLTETLLLTTAAGVLGFAIAAMAPYVMLYFGFVLGGLEGFVQLPPEMVRSVRPSFYAPDRLIFVFAMTLAAMTTVIAGLAPALRATRTGLSLAAAERHGPSVEGSRLRFVLLTTQIALTTLCLLGAALLTRTVSRDSSVDTGFPIENLHAVSLTKPAGWSRERMNGFVADLQKGLKDSGVGASATSQMAPFEQTNYVMVVRRPDEPPDATRMILSRPVSRNYFQVLGLPIVKGRPPQSDTDPREIVVSESTARMVWPNADPIGQTILDFYKGPNEPEERVVVGVAKDVPVRSMTGSDPVIYRWPEIHSTLLIRSAFPNVTDRILAITMSLDPSVKVSARPYAAYLHDALASARLSGHLAWIVGMLCLIVASVGAFGVFGFLVQQRRREIGIRMALGAQREQIVGLVASSIGRALVGGLSAGFLLTVLSTPLLHFLLFGLKPLDPIAYATVTGILALAVLAATWIPLRRAVSVDPAVTLREE
jgi:predicted permease